MESASAWRAPLMVLILAAWALMAVNASAGVGATTDLSATVDDGLAEVESGDNLTYTIVTANAGPDDVTGATVSNTLSAGLSCTWTCSASAGSSCTASGSDEIADTVDILSGGSLTYTATCNVTASGGDTVTNSVTITEPAAGAVTDPDPANNTASDSTSVTTPVVEADLSVTVSDGQTQVTTGDDVTYTLVAANAGPSDVTGATLANTLSAGLSCSSWSCSASAGSSCTASGTGEINDTVDILSGGSLTYTANCNVSASGGATVTNAATITEPGGITDNNQGNNNNEDSTSVIAAIVEADLSVAVSSSQDQITSGQDITFTSVAANAGPNAVTGATFGNTFSTGLSCTWTCSASSGSNCTASGSGEINDSVDILSGGNLTYTASCAVAASAVGSVTSSASIAAPAGITDSNAGNNSVTGSATIRAAGEPIPTLGLWSLLVLALGLLGIGLRRSARARVA